MKFNGIFLDDERNPSDVTWLVFPDGIVWKVVRTMEEFVSTVDSSLDDLALVSFDHDLQDFAGGEEHTGYDCLQYLVETCMDEGKRPPLCMFHTQNIIGKENMQGYYSSYIDFISGK